MSPRRNSPTATERYRLKGLTRIPILSNDGEIVSTEGYDPVTQLYHSPVTRILFPLRRHARDWDPLVGPDRAHWGRELFCQHRRHLDEAGYEDLPGNAQSFDLASVSFNNARRDFVIPLNETIIPEPATSSAMLLALVLSCSVTRRGLRSRYPKRSL